MFKKKTAEDIIVDLVVYISLIFVGIVTLYPFLNVLAVSFNDALDTVRGGIYIWPRKWTLKTMKLLLAIRRFTMQL